jgi:hypothetical protein
MEIFLALAIIERCTLRRIFYLNISIKIVLKVFDELIGPHWGQTLLNFYKLSKTP